MSSAVETQCPLLVSYDKQSPTQKELREKIEKGDTATKIEAVKDMIALTLNGEPQTKMIMPVIRFIQPAGSTTSTKVSSDPLIHTLKKIVLYFWEVMDKVDSKGNLLPELILVVDSLRRDLSHPNEFVRGATLRFLCRLKEKEILEPLAPTVLECLAHAHGYVRKNAVLAILNIYKRVPEALPDSHEVIETLLESETDITAKRNCFLMLFHCVPDRAVEYLRSIMDTPALGQGGDVFQLAVVELLKQLMQTNPEDKSQYIKVIFTLLQSQSEAVLFPCATTLLALTSSPTAIKASATTLVNLLNKSSDHNVKIVIVGKLEDIKKRFPEALSQLTMDLLRCLVGSEIEIQKRVLTLASGLVTQKNVEKVITFLKKELVESSATTTSTHDEEYRKGLIKFIHQSTVKHNSVAPMIVPILMDFVLENSNAAVDAMLFVRETIQRQPDLREDVVSKLALSFDSITSVRVFRLALWILGTHSASYEEVMNVLRAFKTALEPFPLWLPEQVDDAVDPDTATAGGGATVREDGTYVMSVIPEGKPAKTENTSFRSIVTNGDFFLASVLASSLVKLVCTAYSFNMKQSAKEHVRDEAKMIITELINLGIHKEISFDAHERLQLCKKLLSKPTHPMMKTFTETSLKGFSEMLKEEDLTGQEEVAPVEKKFIAVDQPLLFSQFAKRGAGDPQYLDMEDVTVAANNEVLQKDAIKNVMQLTGLSDPVYVEATVQVHRFDILLEMLVVNKTQDTLQNLTAELVTVENLKLCERPQTYTVAPGEEVTIKANMKVSSTEAGDIFGNIVYDYSRPGSDQAVIVLNDLHIDIIDYIHPASCNSNQFRNMWQDFEWENPLTVQTELKSLKEYLDRIVKLTNMRCQSSSTSLAGDADFLSANLYAKSSFGEPVVANISISTTPTGIEGYVRVRSRSQGIALALGNKVVKHQKA
ncbi:Coatomer subunit beta-2 [Diplonema papillatum]|nr:Coatomer subunit beta-2 [Diplonema papillatum]